MKIFISWSGDRSRIIAEGLNNWLPKVIQALKPFYSPEIEKGTRGIAEINKSLEGTSFGIICLTPDNLKSEWIHYEAGALSKIEEARIWTLLHDLKPSDVAQPLAQFQHTLTQKAEVYKLLISINSKLPEPLDKNVLTDSFERWWSDFEEVLLKAEKTDKLNTTESEQKEEIIRSDRDILEEVLQLLRNQNRTIDFDLPEADEDWRVIQRDRQNSIISIKFSMPNVNKITEEKITQLINTFFENPDIIVDHRLENQVKIEIRLKTIFSDLYVMDSLQKLKKTSNNKIAKFLTFSNKGFRDELEF